MRTITAELITLTEAREAIKNSAASDGVVNDLIRGAREAAEDYLRFPIAASNEDEQGFTAEELPRTLKTAMYFWMACTHEMIDPALWIGSFRAQLAPWREWPCV